MRLREKSVCCAERNNACAYESVYYLSATDGDMVRVRIIEIGDDIYDNCFVAYSSDHGRNWTEDEPYQVSKRTDEGTVRWNFGNAAADPFTGRVVVLFTQSLLPHDENLECLSSSFPLCRVSQDCGKTWLFEERIIQSDDDETYSPEHPIKSIWVGKNAVHFANEPFFCSSEKLIVPVQTTRLNPDGTLYCPPGALSFHELMILIGSWRTDGRLDWQASEKVILEADVSTRGLAEGAVAEMPDGRFLMVMRGSNDGNPKLPSRKWYCVSDDGCHTWSPVQPWGYDDGELFYSPAAWSTIVKHSNGRYYWFGNICSENPVGNNPRYPVVAGIIDPERLLLIRDSVTVIDTRTKDDPREIYLSNFGVYEERPSGDMVMRMPRLWVDDDRNIRGDAYLYRIEP